MKAILAAAFLSTSLFTSAHAATYILPLGGDITISGPIATVEEVTLSIAVFGVFPPNDLLVAKSSFGAVVFQSFLSPSSNSGYNVVSDCVAGSGGGVKPCGPFFPASVTFLITDADRNWNINVFLYSNNAITGGAKLTLTLPDNLYITPLPATLPLFAMGLGGLIFAASQRRRWRPALSSP